MRFQGWDVVSYHLSHIFFLLRTSKKRFRDQFLIHELRKGQSNLKITHARDGWKLRIPGMMETQRNILGDISCETRWEMLEVISTDVGGDSRVWWRGQVPLQKSEKLKHKINPDCLSIKESQLIPLRRLQIRSVLCRKFSARIGTEEVRRSTD